MKTNNFVIFLGGVLGGIILAIILSLSLANKGYDQELLLNLTCLAIVAWIAGSILGMVINSHIAYGAEKESNLILFLVGLSGPVIPLFYLLLRYGITSKKHG
ncbi:MAG: hypothetical protein ABIA11_02915 [Patescibacteria group bacterium]